MSRLIRQVGSCTGSTAAGKATLLESLEAGSHLHRPEEVRGDGDHSPAGLAAPGQDARLLHSLGALPSYGHAHPLKCQLCKLPARKAGAGQYLNPTCPGRVARCANCTRTSRFVVTNPGQG